jgi:hypothetical protein
MTIAKWKDRLEEVCVSERQMTLLELPEEDFRDAFRCGYTPEEFFIWNSINWDSRFGPWASGMSHFGIGI